MTRTIRSTWSLSLAFLLAATGSAMAQEAAPPEGGAPAEAAPTEGAPAEAAPAEGAPAEGAPAEASTSGGMMGTKGRITVGLGVMLAPGPDEMAEYGLGNWLPARLSAKYGAMDNLEVGAKLYLALLKPDVPDPFAPKTFGGFTVGANYMVNDMLGVGGDLGMMTPGAFALSIFDTPVYFGDLKFGFGVGPRLQKAIDKIHIDVAGNFIMQLDSDTNDQGEETAFMGFSIPVSLAYAVSQPLTIGLYTGLYSGADFKVSADDGGRIPLFVGAMYDVGPVNVGAGVGFASLITSDSGFYPGVGDTLAIGAMAEWSNQ